MARMKSAVWVGPTDNRTRAGMGPVRGLVLHIQQGYESGSEAWFKNPASKASAHFLNPKAGPLRQLVDTRDRAWAQAAGNPNWISLENEGFVPDALTPSQVENAASLLEWLHTRYGVPLEVTDDVNGSGLGWHGMGGKAWGGHPDCPGDAILHQRMDIVRLARELAGHKQAYVPFPGAAFFRIGRRSPVIAAMHARLVAEGCDKYKSHENKDLIGPGDVASYQAWQRKCGYTGKAATWPPGPATWNLLKVPLARK